MVSKGPAECYFRKHLFFDKEILRGMIFCVPKKTCDKGITKHNAYLKLYMYIDRKLHGDMSMIELSNKYFVGFCNKKIIDQLHTILQLSSTNCVHKK